MQEIKDGSLDVADRFFSKEEKEVLAMTGEEARRDLFCEMWSLKEAYIKCIGMGLSKPLDEFGVVKKDGEYRLIVNGEWSKDYHFHKYDIDEKYSLCVCSQGAGFPTETEYVKLEDLYLT